MTFIALYFLVGTGFAHRRKLDIAADATNGDLIATALRWVITWPLWVGRSR